MRRERRVAREARVAPVRLRRDAHRVLGQLARLGVVERAARRARRREAARALGEAVQVLADLRPDAVGADEHVGVRLRAVGERRDHAAAVAQVLVALDARLDAHRSRGEACMVKRNEIVSLAGLWLEGHGHQEGSEVLGLSSRVRRAAPSLQMQSDEPVVARYHLAKTATLTMLGSRA